MFTQEERTTAQDSEICCAYFDAKLWDNVQHHWEGKLFLKDSIPEFLHIPLPGTYAKAIGRMWKLAENAGAAPGPNEFLLLAHDPSPFKAELFMYITQEIPGAKIERLSGAFFTKVFEASYGEVPQCLRKTDEYLAANSMVSKKYYINFPYCPKCAKKYGHNYVVVFAQVEPI